MSCAPSERREERAMGYKEILVTVDTAPAGSARLDLAAALAERFEAHLIGLHTSLTPLVPPGGRLFRAFRPLAARPLYGEFSDRMRRAGKGGAIAVRRGCREAAARRRVARCRRFSVRKRRAARPLCRSDRSRSDRSRQCRDGAVRAASRRSGAGRRAAGARRARMPAGSRRAAAACWSPGTQAAPRRARSTMRCRCSPRRKR